MSLRTPLARVRHLGSAKDGTGHWWAQRLTALAQKFTEEITKNRRPAGRVAAGKKK